MNYEPNYEPSRWTTAYIAPTPDHSQFRVEVLDWESGIDFDCDMEGNSYIDGYYTDKTVRFFADGFDNVYDAEQALFTAEPYMKFIGSGTGRNTQLRFYQDVD